MSTPAPQAIIVPSVDGDLRHILALVESSGNMHAQRFERATFNKITAQGTSPVLIAIQKANQCNADTARTIYSTSYGTWQEMGFNIYSRIGGYTKSIAEFLTSLTDQQTLYANYLVEDNINLPWAVLKADSAKLDHFSILYNGSTAYSDRVRAAAKELGL